MPVAVCHSTSVCRCCTFCSSSRSLPVSPIPRAVSSCGCCRCRPLRCSRSAPESPPSASAIPSGSHRGSARRPLDSDPRCSRPCCAGCSIPSVAPRGLGFRPLSSCRLLSCLDVPLCTASATLSVEPLSKDCLFCLMVRRSSSPCEFGIHGDAPLRIVPAFVRPPAISDSASPSVAPSASGFGIAGLRAADWRRPPCTSATQ